MSNDEEVGTSRCYDRSIRFSRLEGRAAVLRGYPEEPRRSPQVVPNLQGFPGGQIIFIVRVYIVIEVWDIAGVGKIERASRPLMESEMKLAIVLCGDHSGELDRKVIEIRADQDENAVIGNAVISAVEEWTLSPGDVIRIQTVEG